MLSRSAVGGEDPIGPAVPHLTPTAPAPRPKPSKSHRRWPKARPRSASPRARVNCSERTKARKGANEKPRLGLPWGDPPGLQGPLSRDLPWGLARRLTRKTPCRDASSRTFRSFIGGLHECAGRQPWTAYGRDREARPQVAFLNADPGAGRLEETPRPDADAI
jgi:hypothetical protein